MRKKAIIISISGIKLNNKEENYLQNINHGVSYCLDGT